MQGIKAILHNGGFENSAELSQEEAFVQFHEEARVNLSEAEQDVALRDDVLLFFNDKTE